MVVYVRVNDLAVVPWRVVVVEPNELEKLEV
jgi:hypothetical protein